MPLLIPLHIVRHITEYSIVITIHLFLVAVTIVCMDESCQIKCQSLRPQVSLDNELAVYPHRLKYLQSGTCGDVGGTW